MKNLELNVDMLIYEGAASNDPLDSIKARNRIQESQVVAASRQEIQVADSTTDLSIGLPSGGTSSVYLLIIVDRDVSIKVNGSSDALLLKTRANGAKTVAYFTRGSITSLSVTNASGAAANLDIIIANK